MIREARPADAAAIAAIWNPVIRDTVATFNAVEKPVLDVERMISDRAASGHGTFICENGDGRVLGFASYSQFRGGIGYRYTVEHTVIVAPQAAGSGAGRALMDVLCAHATTAGMHSLWAGISSENRAGIAFHERMGFDYVATLPEAGWKFDRWFNLVLMQKRL